MPLDKQSTTLTQAPYYDDYDETKNYHRVLFKPSVAVQARELTQLQTILQNQIERFGDNVYQTGTIIKGCSLSTDDQYYYVKLLDLQPDGQNYTLASLANTYIVDEATSGLKGIVVNYSAGGQQLDPDLNTLYFKYLNTGTDGSNTFANSAVLTCYHRDYRVESIAIANGGAGYSNNDTVVISGPGSGAHAQIITYANTVLRSINVTVKGSGYTTVPTASITSANGGTGGVLQVANYIAKVQVANSFYSANGTSSPVGRGTAVKTSDGIIYQKGHFVRVEEHEQILSKYDTNPTGVVVGFTTNESVVNSNSDSTLLDNAGGTTNVNAPGADRLKLTANLQVLATSAAASNNEFLSLYEYENGRVVRDRTATQFNTIAKDASRRTYEESGNYVVQNFPMYTESSNATHLSLNVGAGVAYVQGNRVQLVNSIRYPVRKGSNTRTESTQTITTNYGGYIYVNEYAGTFDITNNTTVALYNDTTTTAVVIEGVTYNLYGRLSLTLNAGIGAPSGGVQIGTARVRSVVHDSGTPGTPSAKYRVYLFDVTMNPGYSFKDTKTIVNGTTGVADVVMDPSLGYAVQYDTEFDTLLFSSGTFAVKQFDNEVVISRGAVSGDAFATSGTLEVSLSSGQQLPYTAGSVLNSVQERDFIIVPNTSIVSANALTGAVSTTSGSNTTSGTSTVFGTNFSVGDYIYVGNTTANETRLITKIVSNTNIQVTPAWTTSFTGVTYTYAYPAGVPINFTGSKTRTITISGNNVISASLGHSINAAANTTTYYDYKLNSPSVKTKSANVFYTKISTASIGNNATGPWSLGVPDVISIEGVFVGAANDYTTAVTTSNRKADFMLDNGQTDNFYGMSSIKKASGSSLALDPNSCLVIAYKALRTNSGSYLSTESYSSIIDDVTTPLPADKIRTQHIPVYTSPKTGVAYNLRDCIDFRPIATNTAVYATSLASATVDPQWEASTKFEPSAYPSPTREFSATVESYLARKDRVVIDTTGNIRVIEGYPSNSPSAPVEPEGSMTIGIVSVPPYPSLSAKDAADSGRPDLGVYVVPQQNRRYTMKDISDIETRIGRLEYYTLLNTLETSTKQLVLPSESNTAIERFKNGFFVDPLSDYNVSNVQDAEYKVMIDPSKGVARPYFSDAKIDLQYNPTLSTNMTRNGDLLTLGYTEKVLFSQPLATRDRNLVDKFWKYEGGVQTFPAFDNFYDVERASVSIAIDIASPLNSLAQATSAALSNFNVSTSLLSTANVGSAVRIASSQQNSDWRNDTYQQQIVKTYQDTKAVVNQGATIESNTYLGNYVNDFSLQQYIREQRIAFVTTGLRPGARHHVFFDGVLVDARVTPASVSLATGKVSSKDEFVAVGSIGANLTANSSGAVAGFLDIPAATYFVGERSVVVMDVDNVASEDTSTSRGVGSFIAYGFNVNSTDLTLSTKTINMASGGFSASTYLSQPYQVQSSYNYNVAVRTGDPLSQTFLVQPQQDNTTGIYLTSIDLFFKAKDPIQGVNIEIHETTDDGNPGSAIVPFSRVYLPSAMVNISNNASAATTFTFPSPVHLRTDSAYALVVYPDANSPEYRVHTAVIGGKDVLDPTRVANANWALGTLFYSTSGISWSPAENEDLKFTARRAVFNNTTGTAVLNNADYEFLTVTNQSGIFRGGEDIAQLHPNTYVSGNVVTVSTNNIITAANLSSTISTGDGVLLITGTTPTLAPQTVDITGTTVTVSTGTAAFLSQYSNGSFIQLGNSTVSSIRQVVSITNTSVLTIDSGVTTGPTTNAAHWQLSPTFQVARVLAANSTTLTLNKRPTINSASANVQVQIQKAVIGTVDLYNSGNNKLYVAQSTSSNTSFRIFPANSSYRGTMIGDFTQARAEVSTIDNVNVNFFRPMFSTIYTPGTSITFDGTLTKSAGGSDSMTYELGSLNKIAFNDNAVVKSKSNEITPSGVVKSFTATLGMSSSTSDTSPALDVNPISIVTTRNIVDNYTNINVLANTTVTSKDIAVDTSQLVVGMGVRGIGVPTGAYITSVGSNTISVSAAATKTANGTNVLTFTSNENTRYGVSKSKYISKRLALAAGMDAEDVKVFITAYKPSSTSVDVYAKILNYTDGESFSDKDWTLLEQVTSASLYSDSLNEEDFREFEFTFPSTPPSTKMIGSVTAAANTTIAGFDTTFSVDLAVGDLIKVVRTSTTADYDLVRVASIASNTSLTTTTGLSFSSTGCTIERVDQPRAAYKYCRNNNIVRYHDDTGASYDTYKYLALKVVLRSPYSYTVPVLGDVRALAVST